MGILSFVLGIFLYPFLGWMTGLEIETLPMCVSIALALALVLHLVIASIMKKGRLWCLLWIPLLAAHITLSWYSDNRYIGRYYEYGYITTYQNGSFGLANKSGINVIENDYSNISVKHDGKIAFCMTRDHRFAIYSLEEKRMIVPLVSNVLDYASIQTSNSGKVGIVSVEGDVLVPFVYDYIYYDSRTFRFHLSRDGIVFSPYKWKIVDYMTP